MTATAPAVTAPHHHLTSTQLCSVAGVTYRNVDYWTRTGLLETAVPARGSGTYRLYAPIEASVARAFVALSVAVGQLKGPAGLAIARHVRERGLRGTVWCGEIGFDLNRLDWRRST